MQKIIFVFLMMILMISIIYPDQLYDELIAAIEKNKTADVKKAIKAGADINTIDSENKTPLIKALILKKISISEILIDNNADLDIKDKTGKTALDYAYATKDYAIISNIAQKSIQNKLKNITEYNYTSTLSGLTSDIKFNNQTVKTSYTKNTVNDKSDININISIGNFDYSGKISIVFDISSNTYNMEFDIIGNNKKLTGKIARKYTLFDNILYTDNINLIFNNIKLNGSIFEARFVRYKNFNINYGEDIIIGDIINKNFDEYYYYDIKFQDKYFIGKKGMMSSPGFKISTNISEDQFFLYFLIEQYDQLIKGMEEARQKKMEEIRNKK